jgi:hypothetical protein
VGIGVRIAPLLLKQTKVSGRLLSSIKNKMKKKEYMEMQKEYKRGSIMLLVILWLIILGAILIDCYGI